jgi:hypothetical protein
MRQVSLVAGARLSVRLGLHDAAAASDEWLDRSKAVVRLRMRNAAGIRRKAVIRNVAFGAVSVFDLMQPVALDPYTRDRRGE